MSKTTASIPKSRSKYLLQFLKASQDQEVEEPATSGDKCMTIYSSVSGGPHRRGNSTQSSHKKPADSYANYGEGIHLEERKEAIYITPKNVSTRRRIK